MPVRFAGGEEASRVMGPAGRRPTCPFRLARALVVLALPVGGILGGCGAEGASGNTAEEERSLVTDGQDLGAPPRGWAWVILGPDTVMAEVADTPEARERGLMFRTELGESEGMLFVYASEAPRAFWMRDTFLPLDIAFMDEAQVIVDIQSMEPETDTLHESRFPAMFALEVNQGWFEARGIGAGTQARIVFGRR